MAWDGLTMQFSYDRSSQGEVFLKNGCSVILGKNLIKYLSRSLLLVKLETCSLLGMVTTKRTDGYTENDKGAFGILYQQNQELEIDGFQSNLRKFENA